MLTESSPRASLWGVVQVSAASRTTYDNPFRDVEFRVTFIAPSGRRVRTLGFHDGGATWRARLLPDEQGTWRFETHSADPELDSLTGAVEVGAAAPDAHGPLRVSGGRHFAHADGTPFFLLGTTQYMALSQGPTELNRTLARLASAPFNKARFMLLGGLMAGTSGPEPFVRDASGTLDYTRPDPAFYREVEDGVRQLQAMGVEADLILFVPYFDLFPGSSFPSGPPSQMGAENDEWYVRYAVSRLSAFANVWWTLANEYDLLKVQKNWDALAAVVAEADPAGHLLSNHHSILAFFDNSAPWVTHVNLQDVLLQRHAAGPRHLGELALDARAIGKPVVVDEYGYEGNNGFTWGSFTGPEMVEMHWAVTLAGAYGSHGESFAGEETGTAFTGDAVRRLRFLRDVIAEAPFHEMAPSDAVFYDGTAFVPMALAEPGQHYLLYFPVARELPDWNLGNFGPATPSRPLPPPVGGQFEMTSTTAVVTVEPGVYRVDLIDPWRCTVRTLGVTDQTTFGYTPRLTPGILRLVRDDDLRTQARPAGELFGGALFPSTED